MGDEGLSTGGRGGEIGFGELIAAGEGEFSTSNACGCRSDLFLFLLAFILANKLLIVDVWSDTYFEPYNNAAHAQCTTGYWPASRPPRPAPQRGRCARYKVQIRAS